MTPALLMTPPTDALLMVMPVAVGAVVPFGVIVPAPVLVTLPVTTKPLLIVMQLMAAGLTTEAADPGPLSVMVHAAARAGGAPAPINRAAADDEASRKRRVVRRTAELTFPALRSRLPQSPPKPPLTLKFKHIPTVA